MFSLTASTFQGKKMARSAYFIHFSRSYTIYTEVISLETLNMANFWESKVRTNILQTNPVKCWIVLCYTNLVSQHLQILHNIGIKIFWIHTKITGCCRDPRFWEHNYVAFTNFLAPKMFIPDGSGQGWIYCVYVRGFTSQDWLISKSMKNGWEMKRERGKVDILSP